MGLCDVLCLASREHHATPLASAITFSQNIMHPRFVYKHMHWIVSHCDVPVVYLLLFLLRVLSAHGKQQMPKAFFWDRREWALVSSFPSLIQKLINFISSFFLVIPTYLPVNRCLGQYSTANSSRQELIIFTLCKVPYILMVYY